MPMGGLDITPIIAYFVYSVVLKLLVQLLMQIGY